MNQPPQPFEHYPGGGRDQHQAQRIASREPCHQPTGGRVVAAHNDDEPEHQENRKRERRLTEYVNRYVEPVSSRQKQAGTIGETGFGRFSRWLT